MGVADGTFFVGKVLSPGGVLGFKMTGRLGPRSKNGGQNKTPMPKNRGQSKTNLHKKGFKTTKFHKTKEIWVQKYSKIAPKIGNSL